MTPPNDIILAHTNHLALQAAHERLQIVLVAVAIAVMLLGLFCIKRWLEGSRARKVAECLRRPSWRGVVDGGRR